MEFSRIVCVSLFSYQGSLSLRQLIYFTTSSRSCQELFSFFSGYFLLLPQLPGSRNGSAVSVLLTACLLYHTFHLMSTTFFNFYNCLNCMFIRCFFDSLVRIPLFHQAVNRYFDFYVFLTVSVSVQRMTRSKPRDLCDFHRYPQSAYVLTYLCPARYSLTSCNEGRIHSARFSISSVGSARSGTMTGFIPAA